jgi:hypothetical protein
MSKTKLSDVNMTVTKTGAFSNMNPDVAHWPATGSHGETEQLRSSDSSEENKPVCRTGRCSLNMAG